MAAPSTEPAGARPRGALAWWVALGYVSTFKPLWAPMILFVEAATHLRNRNRPRDGAGWIALACGMALPVALLALHSTESLRVFFTRNLPMYLSGAYTHYDTGYAEFASSPLHLQLVAGLALVALSVAVALRAGIAGPRQALAIAGTAALAYGAVVHQHKFWSYHAVPVFALTLVPGAWLWARLLSRAEPRREPSPPSPPSPGPGFAPGAAALAGALILLPAAVSTRDTVHMLTRQTPLGAPLVPLVAEYPRPMFFSMSVTTAYAPMLLQRPLVGPFTVLVDLPEILALPDAAERGRRLASYGERIRTAIRDERPDLLVYSPETLARPGDVPLHTVLAGAGVDPAALGYRRVPASRLARLDPRLAGWDVYERAASD